MSGQGDSEVTLPAINAQYYIDLLKSLPADAMPGTRLSFVPRSQSCRVHFMSSVFLLQFRMFLQSLCVHVIVCRVPEPTLTLILMCCAGYEDFLESRVAEEVTNLPRGIYHSSLSRQHLANHSKALTALPAFLAHEYERNKQPAMRPPLARKTCFLLKTYTIFLSLAT